MFAAAQLVLDGVSALFARRLFLEPRPEIPELNLFFGFCYLGISCVSLFGALVLVIR